MTSSSIGAGLRGPRPGSRVRRSPPVCSTCCWGQPSSARFLREFPVWSRSSSICTGWDLRSRLSYLRFGAHGRRGNGRRGPRLAAARRAGDGRSRGLGRAIAASLAAEGARVAISSSLGEESRGGALGDRWRGERICRRCLRAREARDPASGGRSGARPDRHPRRQHRRPAARAAPSTTRSPSGKRPTARSCSAPRVLVGAVLPGMRERGWGRIVNIGSNSTVEPIPALTLSNANRLAAIGFLKTLSREVAADGITVNTIATGKFATDRLAENEGSLENAERDARETVPAARLGLPGGVRRPRRLPRLRPRRLHHRNHDPDRRRTAALSLLSAGVLTSRCGLSGGSPLSSARSRIAG